MNRSDESKVRVSARRSLDVSLETPERSLGSLENVEEDPDTLPTETPFPSAGSMKETVRKAKKDINVTARAFRRRVRVIKRQCATEAKSAKSEDVEMLKWLMNEIDLIFEEADRTGFPEDELEELEEYVSTFRTIMFKMENADYCMMIPSYVHPL
eukprot:g3229.t1